MANNTKEKILDAALQLISENGYEGTNIRDLSGALGLTKSAFYKHYDSKEELWNTIINEMNAYYEQHFGSENNLPEIPDSAEELRALTLKMVDFTIHDKKVIMTRKILLTEQFRSEKVRKIATDHFNVGLEGIFTQIFSGMMKNGSLKNGDPAMLAFAYTAPITSLVHLCDREPEKEAEIIEKLENFINHFIEIYKNND